MANRPGLGSVGPLPEPQRGFIQALNDIVGRVTGILLPKLKPISGRVKTNLDPASATTAQIATRVNELAQALNGVTAKQGEVISRIQED